MKPYILGLVIFIATLIINAILVNFHYNYMGEVTLAIISAGVGVVYMLAIKKDIMAKDMFKASLTVYLGFVILRLLPYLSMPSSSLTRAFFAALAGGIVSFIIVYINLSIVYAFFGPKKKKQSAEIYSVTDDIIANQVIKVLSENSIEAYSMQNNSVNTFTASGSGANAISIRLKNTSQKKHALNIIKMFFKDLEDREPWTCPDCNEKIEGSFQACWNCGYEQ